VSDAIVVREGTVVSLAGRRVAIGNIWEGRYEVGGEARSGVTAMLHFEDDTRLLAGPGTVLDLGAERWRVAAVREGRPHGEVTFEREA
jgi:hypothetical protein